MHKNKAIGTSPSIIFIFFSFSHVRRLQKLMTPPHLILDAAKLHSL